MSSDIDYEVNSDTDDDMDDRYGYDRKLDDFYGNFDEDLEGVKWQLGQLVAAKWHEDEEFYIGEIDEVNADGTYNVAFEDDDYSRNVTAENIRAHFIDSSEEDEELEEVEIEKTKTREEEKKDFIENSEKTVPKAAQKKYTTHEIEKLKKKDLVEVMKENGLSNAGKLKELKKRAIANLCHDEEMIKGNSLFFRKLKSQDREGSGIFLLISFFQIQFSNFL